MTNERYRQLSEDENVRITHEEFMEGWHYCAEFDNLLVGIGMSEMENCSCPFPKAVESLRKQIEQLTAELEKAKSNPMVLHAYRLAQENEAMKKALRMESDNLYDMINYCTDWDVLVKRCELVKCALEKALNHEKREQQG